MALLTKPNMQQVWASGGDIVEPSDLKKQQGWTVEVPPHQFENWIQNRQDEYLAHINQRGIPAWDGLTDYEAGGLSYVQGSDGKVYKSVAASGPSSVVSNPTTDGTDTYWTIAFADVGAFLTQAAGDARYTQRSNNLNDLTNVATARANLGLIKQTSTTDTTAGALMAVGAFGLGATGSGWNTYDLDTLDGSGFYNVNGATSTNLPSPGAFGFLTFIDSTVNDGYQIFTSAGVPSTASTLYRTKVAGVWGAWQEIALTTSPAFTGTPTAPTAAAGTNTTQLATTAFVTTADNLKANINSPTFTGVPSAPTPASGTRSTAIATMQNFANEFGSSLAANGYQKLPSGMIIQWGRYAGGAVGPSISFPITFPAITASLNTTSNPEATSGGSMVEVLSVTNSGFTARVDRFEGTDQSGPFYWTAIGY